MNYKSSLKYYLLQETVQKPNMGNNFTCKRLLATPVFYGRKEIHPSAKMYNLLEKRGTHKR
jgi:hypothetical protein